MSIILAVDDDRHILKILEQQIESLRHKIIIAKSGSEGLEFAQTGNPDLILLDIFMPDMDGHMLMKKLRKNNVTKQTPVIMLTSSSKKSDVTEAMRYGAIDYIVKPHNFKILANKIESALKQRSTIEPETRTNYITIKRDKGVTIISFFKELRSNSIIDEIKRSFNSSFLNLTKNDNIVLDLRGIPDFLESDIFFLEKIFEIFNFKKVHVVTGKHYGALVTFSNFEDKLNLFISLGDFEIFIEDAE